MCALIDEDKSSRHKSSFSKMNDPLTSRVIIIIRPKKIQTKNFFAVNSQRCRIDQLIKRKFRSLIGLNQKINVEIESPPIETSISNRDEKKRKERIFSLSLIFLYQQENRRMYKVLSLSIRFHNVEDQFDCILKISN